MRILFKRQWIGILLCAVFLVGCCDHTTPTYVQKTYTYQDYVNMLQKKGVTIIQTGETYTLVIPSDDLFNPNSANFSDGAMEILGPLAGYLFYYDQYCNDLYCDCDQNYCGIVFMKISGYTDSGGELTRNIALSEKQAQKVQEFLTSRGMHANMIEAVGYGPYYPIADNSIPSHAVQNRRIVIKFRRLQVPPLV